MQTAAREDASITRVVDTLAWVITVHYQEVHVYVIAIFAQISFLVTM